MQECACRQRWWEGSLLNAHGLPWQQHILGGFHGFLGVRQPALLSNL